MSIVRALFVRLPVWLLVGLLGCVLGPSLEATPERSGTAASEVSSVDLRAGVAEIERLLDDLASAALDPTAALEVGGVRLDTGFAVLDLERGLLVPVRTAAGRTTELVFVGNGRLEVTPPDAIEAGQLELFTGSSPLVERFDEAVLVVGRDVALASLLARPTMPAPAELAARAATRHAAWRTSRERRLAGTDAGLALDALGDAVHETFFTAWIGGRRLGDFLLSVRPDDDEPLTLGRFVPLGASAREARQLERQLRRQQRRGRWLGLTVDDLGTWDTWMSTHLPDAAALAQPERPATAIEPLAAPRTRSTSGFSGGPSVEPLRYRLEVDARPRRGELVGRGWIDVRAVSDGRRAVRLALHRDLALDRLSLDDVDLPVRREGGEIVAFLPVASRRDARFTLAVEWSGRFFEQGPTGIGLRDPLLWQPHLGQRDLALYDVTLRYPRTLELLASGTVVSRETDGRWQVERRRLDSPGRGFGFSIGDYRIESATVHTPHGQIEVRLGIDPELGETGRPGADGRRLDHASEVIDALASSLAVFDEIFGPYPFERLEAASVPGEVSRALPGFVSLSQVMLLSRGDLATVLGLEDRRSVIAHEVAHQWWGHRVGWRSDRDQWISEAMANYAALLWARRLDVPALGRGPTDGWQDELLRRLPDGRTVESVGPLVLGGRLASSRAPDAYQAIVYRKGAVVLDMLARRLGEDRFPNLLGAITRAAAGAPDGHLMLSTEDLLAHLGELADTPLDDFAQRFVYGTGLAEVIYDWSARELPPREAASTGERPGPSGELSDGSTVEASAATDRWRITVRAEQSPPWRPRYAIVRRADGHLDVALRGVEERAIAEARLAVPIRIVLARDDAASRLLERLPAGTLPDGADLRTALIGDFLLDGRTSERTVDIDGRPALVELDPERRVFARFLDARSHPKQVAFRRARDLALAGAREDADALLESALDLRTPRAALRDDEEQLVDTIDGLTDALIHLQRAELALDGDAPDRLEVAEARLDAATESLPAGEEDLVAAQLRRVRSRLDLLAGRADEAFERLRRDLIDDDATDDLGAWLLLAIAADATGHAEELERARVLAVHQGADLGPLTPGEGTP
ncbi:MAG: M1 family aminopeptidase [Acidobacteriota bacterium]